MSTKRFCDLCDEQILSGEGQAELVAETKVRKFFGGRADAQVTISLDFGDLELDVCVPCIFRAARSIDPAPRIEEST